MANGSPKKGGGGGRDMVMESRHLLGVFLGVVVLCGVFFTLGYVMGRTQYESSVRAALATSPAKPAPAPEKTAASTPKPAVPAASEWTFPSATSPKRSPETIQPLEPKPKETRAAASTAPPAATTSSKPLLKKAVPSGSIVLQVAALTRDADALALAEALQKKEYPAFVLTPSGDNLYRVQVGPFLDEKAADLAKRSLERDGFKAITKR